MVVRMRNGDRMIHGLATGMSVSNGEQRCFAVWLSQGVEPVVTRYGTAAECDAVLVDAVRFRRTMGWEVDGRTVEVTVPTPGSHDIDYLRTWAGVVVRPMVSQAMTTRDDVERCFMLPWDLL